MKKGIIVSINLSAKKGEKKMPVRSVMITESGLAGDAHSGDWHRQISLLGIESIEIFKVKLATIAPGDFAENITTRGIDWETVKVGTRISAGKTILEVSQIGKECHHGCSIREKVGDCVMPKEGIFAKVIIPGTVNIGDAVQILG
ncbi:MAG: MOSC domain-containing protein [Candidatus Thermoplasmatota archaeon]|nr:MOSC domain-containing protein [Euryarchaeota archaeon]MBU4032441.1 MOSC domain-containing protein [Candidatus Thermoplasmatota archaeon]MBU4144479.1 MOSC domain-containing protein [Candidatus Thermoplasmatota archaeon]MBU4592289.1 MOSC domain-containing protein [Candidatus Thermoplasmatota archaeon]